MKFWYNNVPHPFASDKERFVIKGGATAVLGVDNETQAMAIAWALNNPESLVAAVRTAIVGNPSFDRNHGYTVPDTLRGALVAWRQPGRDERNSANVQDPDPHPAK